MPIILQARFGEERRDEKKGRWFEFCNIISKLHASLVRIILKFI